MAMKQRTTRGILTAVLVLLALAIALPQASAQEASGAGPAPEAPAPPLADADRDGATADRLRDLVATLEDEARREELVVTLEALIAANDAATTTAPRGGIAAVASRLITTLASRLNELSAQLVWVATTSADLPTIGRWIERQATVAPSRRLWLEMAAVLAVVLCSAWLTGRLARRAIRTARDTAHTGARHWIAGLFEAFLGLFRAFLPIAAFAAIAYVALAAAPLDIRVRSAGFVVVWAVVVYRVVIAIADLALAPGPAGRAALPRLLPVSDEAASYAIVWTHRLTLIATATYAAANAALILGLPRSGFFVVSRLGGLIFAGLAITLVLQNRRAVALALRRWPQRGSRFAFLARIGEVWHLAALAYIAAAYFIWTVQIGDGFAYLLRASLLTVAIVAISWALQFTLSRLIDEVLAGRIDDLRFPSLRARVNRYVSVVHGALRIAIAVVAIFAILEAWQFGLLDVLDGELGRSLVGGLFNIAVVLALAVAVWEISNSWIEGYLTEDGGDGAPIARSQRVQTLLPLLRTALTITLVIVTGMTVLSELGLNITPLLASAGVLGLAIGFGSQKLVQDVITGVFILMENTIRVGDVATAGVHTGVVENITIRTIQLRDLEGAVHTVPFSEVTTIINLTKDYSYKLFEVGVAYREDTDYVTGVLVELADQMRGEPGWSHDILEPMEILGVERFEDSAVVIRVRLKTRPLSQWRVGREFNRRMKKRFDELGIEIPFPHHTLYFGVDRQGNAPPAPVRLVSDERPAPDPA